MTFTYETFMEEHSTAAALLANRAHELVDNPVYKAVIDDPAFKIVVVRTFIEMFPEIKDTHRPLVFFEAMVAIVLAKLEQG